MSSDHVHHHIPAWGLLLTGIGSTAILWLALTGQLDLYIHPRYFAFTAFTASIAAITSVAAYALRGRNASPGRGWGAALATAAVVLTLLIVPPTTLDSSMAQQRSVNSSVDTNQSVKLVGADPSRFTLRDWAALVTDPATAPTYAGHQVTLTGFVAPADESSDTFYLARFVVTCCTVDALPVGIPVRLSGWATKYRPDQWLEVTGTLVPATDAPDGAVLVLKPSKLRAVAEPAEPYEY